MSETVDNDIRDKIMEGILAKPGNQTCFDCGSKAPNWSSPYLGIVICYECAAKHRSYGTHISFVRSTDLDKWNRKQLKSLELTGNSYTKERFNDLGVPLIGGNYDYNNSMVLKVRQEIADKVKESLRPDEYIKKESIINNDKIKFDEEIKENIVSNKKNDQDLNEKIDINNSKNGNEDKEDKEEKDDEPVPKKFHVNKKEKINKVEIKGKAGKKNKIKKVDFDFDFDSFNDVNFSDFNKPNEDKEDEDKKDEEDSNKKEEIEKEKEKESEEGYNKSYDIKLSKKEINKKFANKKAISSEDYAALENNDNNNKETKAKIKSMGNSQAISSEDVFGSEGGPSIYDGKSMTDKIKDFALDFTIGAAEKAKELKNKTSELINRVQNKFSGNTGY